MSLEKKSYCAIIFLCDVNLVVTAMKTPIFFTISHNNLFIVSELVLLNTEMNNFPAIS